MSSPILSSVVSKVNLSDVLKLRSRSSLVARPSSLQSQAPELKTEFQKKLLELFPYSKFERTKLQQSTDLGQVCVHIPPFLGQGPCIATCVAQVFDGPPRHLPLPLEEKEPEDSENARNRYLSSCLKQLCEIIRYDECIKEVYLCEFDVALGQSCTKAFQEFETELKKWRTDIQVHESGVQVAATNDDNLTKDPVTATVSIIGTAGKSTDPCTPLLNGPLFEAMTEEAWKIITETFQLDPKDVILVSGGAAWSDHVAVRLFLTNMDKDLNRKFKGLRIHPPCRMVKGTKRKFEFEENGSKDWRQNPGYLSNLLHDQFTLKVKRSSLTDILHAKQQDGVVLDESSFGFHNRNSKVATSDYLIAFTWSSTSEPSDGGTKDTWNKFKGPERNKVHVSLHKLR